VAKAETAGAFVVSRVSILNCPLDREVYGLGMGCLGLHEFHSLTVMRSKSRYVSVLGRKRFVEARRELGRLRRHEQGCWPLRASEGSYGFVTRVDGRNGMADYCEAGEISAAFRNLCQLLPRASTKQQRYLLGISSMAWGGARAVPRGRM
jgi:hypothetical protein